MKFALLLLVLMLPAVVMGESLVLLSIPLSNGKKYNYVIDQKEKCNFKGVTEIDLPELEKDKKKKSLYDKANYLQRKINLVISESEITDDRIFFSLSGAENFAFEFYFKKENCKLVRVFHYDEDQFIMNGLELEFSTFLKNPVLEKITVKSGEADVEDLKLYPWALRGNIALYEFNLGPAVNIHSNIRLNNRNAFDKNHPVIEPIPAFFFRYGPIFLNKNGLGSLLFTHEDFSVIGMGILEGEPYDGENLTERKTGVFVGTILKYNLAELTFYNDFFKDRGYNVKLNLAPQFYYKLSWKFTPQAFVQYWDDKYVDYYFGVTDTESQNSGLKSYKGTHTINYGALLETIYYRNRWTWLLSAGIKMYGKEVMASPTVTRDEEVRVIGSVLYKFF